MIRINKLLTFSLTFGLSIGIMSNTVAPTIAAATNQNKIVTKHQPILNPNTQQKVDEILSKLDSDLAKIGAPVSKHHAKCGVFANLDDKTKAKVKEIMKKVKDGTLTKEEADKQLKSLGVSFPKHHKADMFGKLDDKTKAKVIEIMKKVKDGTLTKEEADKQLKALGVSFPKHHEKFKPLNNETKAKAKALIEDAKAHVNKLGAEFPAKKYGYLMR
ncbi:hypothetical protein [Rummeliibacillus pycnus]|uniref:hypothetical protein n=1 Tax=Rummeliibacillus pycnus TaxID=101070 RepID=UPI003D272F93